MAIQPIDTNILSTIGGQTQGEAMARLGQAVRQAREFREQQLQNQSMNKLRNLQMASTQLQMEKSQYDFAQEQLQDEIEVAQALAKKRYHKRYTPPASGASAQEHERIANAALASGATEIAKHHFDMAKEAGKTPKGSEPLTDVSKYQADIARARAEGRLKDIPALEAGLQKALDQEAATTQIAPETVLAAIPDLVDQVGEDDVAGFGETVAGIINTRADVIRKSTSRVLDKNAVLTAVIKEAKLGDESEFARSAKWGTTDVLDYERVNAYVNAWVDLANMGVTSEDLSRKAAKLGVTYRQVEMDALSKLGYISKYAKKDK